MLTRDEILNIDDRITEVVQVPEWKDEVTIAAMSGFARDRFEASIVGNSGGANMQNIRAKLCAASIVDENGELMFSEKDVVKLGKKSSAALDRIFSAAQKLNRISDDDVEDLAKN
jgi:hypothetical protein